jgi:hypothetical protein
MTFTQIQSTKQNTIDAVGGLAARYGLVIVIAAFGLLKFTNYEAQGIQPLVSESPVMSWLYDIFSVYTFSVLLGVFELAAAVLIAVKPWWPQGVDCRQRARYPAVRRDHQLPVHHARRFRRIGGISRPVADHWFPVQGRGLAWYFGVDAGRRAEGNPQQSRRFLTGSRNLAMRHWRV